MTDQINPTQTFWKKCSSCRKEIAFGGSYYLCSVSTCKHERTGFQFCSVACWDAHLGYARHRSAFAEEARAPRSAEVITTPQLQTSAPRDPVKKIIAQAPSPSQTSPVAAQKTGAPPTTDTLVVVSKVKQLIKDQVGFNTSECCIDALTRKVVDECLKGITKAQSAGRKTVMGRDIL